MARPTAASARPSGESRLSDAILCRSLKRPNGPCVRFFRFVAVLGGFALATALASTAAAGGVADPSPPSPTTAEAPAALRPALGAGEVPPSPRPAPAVRELKPVGDVESEIRDAAKLYNLDPALVRAVAVQESGLRNEARSRRGALGVMQMMPGTAKELGYDAADLRGNVRAGAAYLSMMMETFGGDVKRALAAYNAGPGAVKRFGGVPPFAETRNYVSAIMEHMAVSAAAVVSQPLSTTMAQLGAKAVQGAAQGAAQVAQAAGRAAAPLAAGAAPFSAAAATLAAGVP